MASSGTSSKRAQEKVNQLLRRQLDQAAAKVKTEYAAAGKEISDRQARIEACRRDRVLQEAVTHMLNPGKAQQVKQLFGR